MTSLILIGECREQLRTLPAKSVHTCVTSPPYFGLRDYEMARQIGLEPTPDEFVAALVEVFREVRRVLRDDGTVWLNLGDTYNAYNGGRRSSSSLNKRHDDILPGYPKGYGLTTRDLKNKDLIGIPWRVAFALQADGWYLRQDIIWSKPNPMPESVRDRCTKAHEYIFLLSAGPRYYYDAAAIAEPASPENHRPSGKTRRTAPGQEPDAGFKNGRYYETRNKRSVWTVQPRAYKGAHFATFPPDLIEPCILAGAPRGGVVLDPFGGSGTVGEVAERHGRDSFLIDLNPDYAPMMLERIGPGAILI